MKRATRLLPLVLPIWLGACSEPELAWLQRFATNRAGHQPALTYAPDQIHSPRECAPLHASGDSSGLTLDGYQRLRGLCLKVAGIS